MIFEKYRESIIEDFEEDCQCCGLNRCLSDEEKEVIRERFNKHINCFNNEYDEAAQQSMELIVSCIYGNKESASIECMACNTIIVDDKVLFGE